MKTTNYYKIKAKSKVAFAFVLSLMMFLSSCKDENEVRSQFALKDNPTKMEVPARGSTETYTVQSSGSWKVEPQRKEKWLKIEPIEGSGDGTFTVTVNKNIAHEVRNIALFFTVDGQLHNSVLKIEQAAATGGEEEEDPYIYLDGKPSKLEYEEAGGVSSYVLRANGKWRLELEDQPDWVTVEPMEGTGDTPLKMTVAKNTDVERATSLLFFLDDVQQSQSVSVYQKGQKLQVSGDIVLKEDFNWLNYGSEIFYTTTGETIIGNWTAEQKAKGWTSSPSSDGSTSVYARKGFVKLGKTNVAADFISPRLVNVQRTKNLIVKFKAAPYMTAAGTKDPTFLRVEVVGPGTVDVSEFNINNWPSAVPIDLGYYTSVWNDPMTERSFVITGATEETKIRFVASETDLTLKKTNRIFIDDVVVTVQ